MKRKILITGGAGYIGSILSEELLKKDYKITIYDNFLYKQNSLAHLCKYSNLEIIRGDVRDFQKIKSTFSKSDIIIPLAALVGAPICKFDPEGSRAINKKSIDFMLENISKDQIILMPTTNSAYGSGDDNNYCDENTKLKPISQYAIDKVEIEKKLTSHKNYISFRLATVFGMSPRMRIDLLVNDFVYRALNDNFIVLFESNFKRNFIHVRDVSRVFIHALDNFDSMKNQIYNVGLSDTNISKKELCEKIKKFIDKFIYFEDKFHKDEDQRNYIVSNKKIENTGFKTNYSLDFGIEELIKGYTSISNKVYSNIF